MDKEDTRYQTMEQLRERRKQVMRLHRKGYGVIRIVIKLSGLSYPVLTKAKLRAAATEHMTMLEQSPERVRHYFGDPKVGSAAS